MKPSTAVEVDTGPSPQASIGAPTRVSSRTSSPTSLQLRCVRQRHPRVSTRPDRGTTLRAPDTDDAAARDDGDIRSVAAVVTGLAGQVTRLPFAALAGVWGAGRATLGWAGHAVEVGIGLPGRVEELLDDTQRLIGSVVEVVAAARQTTAGAAKGGRPRRHHQRHRGRARRALRTPGPRRRAAGPAVRRRPVRRRGQRPRSSWSTSCRCSPRPCIPTCRSFKPWTKSPRPARTARRGQTGPPGHRRTR